MNFYTEDRPIIACSTGENSNTAIAVLRLSGFENIADLQRFFSFPVSKIRPRVSHLTNIIFNNEVFDNGLLVFFPQGKSFTGENLLELSVHGNQLNIQRILNLFIDEGGFSPAGPGEFTYRALKNKKLSLSQVEGLDLLLNANSNLMLSQGLDIMQGELHSQYMRLYEAFIKLKSAVEISIDFSEDVGEEESKKLVLTSLKSFLEQVNSLYARTQGNISSLLSPEAVLVGQTNAGKSSLFNLLVKHNRSIVSSIAGTTRDYISEVIHIDGTNYKLVDTAGIRESQDVIENIGIDRAFEILNRAFFKVLIVNPFETNPQYLEKLSHIDFDLLIISHSDVSDFDIQVKKTNFANIKTHLVAAASFANGSIGPLSLNLLNCGSIGPNKSESGSIEPHQKTGSIEPAKAKKIAGPIEPKALTTIGPIEPVVKNLLAEKYRAASSNNPILLERHRSCIAALYHKSKQFSCDINQIDDIAIISSEVNMLGNHLSELIGIVTPDQVLNSIFANFCIGK